MCLASYAHHDRALLHGFGGIFDLEDPALRRAVELSVHLCKDTSI